MDRRIIRSTQALKTALVDFSISLMLCAFPGATYMSSIALKEVYGVMDYSAVLSIVMIGMNFCNMFGASFYGYVFDLTKSYSPILWIQIMVVAISIVFTYIIYKKKDILPWTERNVDNKKG